MITRIVRLIGLECMFCFNHRIAEFRNGTTKNPIYTRLSARKIGPNFYSPNLKKNIKPENEQRYIYTTIDYMWVRYIRGIRLYDLVCNMWLPHKMQLV